MNRWLARSLSILVLLGAVFLSPAISGSAALDSDLIWSQIANGSATFGPSIEWTGEYDQEIADDFDITGTIERIVAGGYGCFQCTPPTVQGVYVRFYEHTVSGPGALQTEYFIPGDDPGFIYDPDEPATLDITLPSPFNATGQHFFSVQMVMNGYWDLWESNRDNPNLSRIYQRDNLGSGEWQFVDIVGMYGNADVVFDLYGTVTGAPRIDSLSHTSLDRSGRLQITGANYGDTQGTGQVLIGGVPAIVGTWSGGLITAYVPETVGPGQVSVQVVTSNGPSNEQTLSVTLRQQVGRLKWRFQAEGLYSVVQPALGPDGSIYAVSVYGELYALTSDGGLQWIVSGAGSKGVDVGPDGTIYAGDENVITAVNPNGTVKWQFEQNPRAFILLGPNVGPDGNIYAVATSGIGVFSLTPTGQLRWTYPEQYRRPITDYQEIDFGYNGSTLQMYFHANDHLRFFSSDGDLVFDSGLFFGRGNPEVGPDQTIYNQGIARYDPDGNLIDSVSYYGASAPHVAPSTGNVYHVASGILRSFLPDLTVRWEKAAGLLLDNPLPDPSDRIIVTGGATSYGVSGFAIALSTQDGSELWRVDFPTEQGLIHIAGSWPSFTPDGNTVYINTLLAGDPLDEYWYIYALDSSGGLPGGCTENCLHSEAINLTAKSKSPTSPVKVTGVVAVQNENGAAVPGATVSVTWLLPNGTTQNKTAITNSLGNATFTTTGPHGTFTLTVTGISKAGYTFDPENSIVTKSITW
jgi:hypothetical protein